MNKYFAVATLFGIAANAFAQPVCGGFGDVKTAPDIRTLLLGKYACVPGQWNEILAGGATGTVTDYKKGPSDPVDPSSRVGTYTITTGVANAYDRITYDYGSCGSYTYVITPKAGTTVGTYDFCNIATGQHISVTVQVGTSC
jgi:hypothetical protein